MLMWVALGLGRATAEQFGAADLGLLELEDVGVVHLAADLHRVPARLSDDGVALLQLQRLDAALEQEAVQVDGGDRLAAAQHVDFEVAAAVRVDAAGAVEVVQDRVRRQPGVQARRLDEAGDVDLDRLRRLERRIDAHVGAEDALDLRRDFAVQVGVAHATHGDRADIGDEDVAVRIDDLRRLEGEGAPHAHGQPVAGGDHVVGVEAAERHRAEAAGEELRAEDDRPEGERRIGRKRQRGGRRAVGAAAPKPACRRRGRRCSREWARGASCRRSNRRSASTGSADR